jgi:glycosyltransferase involved in cell wall biosynthesis
MPPTRHDTPAARETTSVDASQVSIIIPVHNGGEAFLHCLHALSRLDPAPLEILVVLDGADDDSGRAAERQGVRVLHMPVRSGPASARNMGARAARGQLLFFLDADVLAPASVVGQVADAFQGDPALSALIGSYDDAPGAPSFLSQYRNLLHHYVHQRSPSRVHTFWGACGAVRREVFLAIGGFDESYEVPAIEDVELGYRLSDAGHRIKLERQLQVKHLKHWTVGNMLRTDVFQRAIPWSRLLLGAGAIRPELNLGAGSRLSALLAWLLVVFVLIGILQPVFLFGALADAVALVAVNSGFYRFLYNCKGWWFAVRAMPWHWLYYLYASASFAYVWLFERHRESRASHRQDSKA